MLKSIRIKNFKSIRDVRVELEDVTVIVGKSGVGKSNFVEAIRFLRDTLLSPPRMETLQAVRPIPPPDQSESTSFEVVFHVNGYEADFEYFLALGPRVNSNKIGAIKENLRVGDRTILAHETSPSPGRHGSGENKWTTPPPIASEKVPPVIALGSFPEIDEMTVAYLALTEGIGCYSFPFDVMSEPTDERIQRKSVIKQEGLSDNGDNYADVFRRIAKNLQDLSRRTRLIEILSHVNETVATVGMEGEGIKSHAIVSHNLSNTYVGLPIWNESEGFRRFFAHLLALYQLPSKFLLLFEHPEDGIHPGALSLLASEFITAASKGRGQVILTTHSPGLLDSFRAEQIRVAEIQDFKTQIGKLASEQIQSLHDRLLHPGELLTVTRAKMESRGDESE